MANPVWPFIPFVALRGAQIFFAIIVLGLSGYIGGQIKSYYYDTGYWSPWFALSTAIFTLIGNGFLLATFFVAPNFTAPLICLPVDGFLWLFWLISLAGFAEQFSLVLSAGSCEGYSICSSIKGDMAMIVFEFLLFLATVGLSGWCLWREHSGKMAGTNPEGGHASAGAIAGAPQTHGTYPMQQPPVMPNPPPVGSTPVPFPQEGQYQYPPQSPPPQQYTQSPPPNQQYPEVPVPQGQQGYPQQY